MYFETRGIPTVTVVTTAFHRPARLQAQNKGMAALPLIILPHPVADLKEGDLRELVEAAYPQIVAALTRGTPAGLDYPVDYTLPWHPMPGPSGAGACPDGSCELG